LFASSAFAQTKDTKIYPGTACQPSDRDNDDYQYIWRDGELTNQSSADLLKVTCSVIRDQEFEENVSDYKVTVYDRNEYDEIDCTAFAQQDNGNIVWGSTVSTGKSFTGYETLKPPAPDTSKFKSNASYGIRCWLPPDDVFPSAVRQYELGE